MDLWCLPFVLEVASSKDRDEVEDELEDELEEELDDELEDVSVYDGSFDFTYGVTIGFGLVYCPRSSIKSPMQESIGGFGQLPVYPQLS